MSLAEDISTFMLIRDMPWKIGEELEHPSPEDVRQTLDKAREILYGEDMNDGATLFVGGMIIKREAEHLDVYLHFGDYNV
jgi:hypothetical protein